MFKYFCIKDCELFNFFASNLEAKCYKDIFYYIRYDPYDQEYAVYTENNDKTYIGTFETDYFATPVIDKFEEYFVTIAEWRDKQIDEILND